MRLNMSLYLVKCPSCGNEQKVTTHKGLSPLDMKKRCVYCGKTFRIHTNKSSNIIKKLK